ncbi:MAG: hypothetical protein ACYC75_01020 [Minisyncoccota bacterium]
MAQLMGITAIDGVDNGFIRKTRITNRTKQLSIVITFWATRGQPIVVSVRRGIISKNGTDKSGQGANTPLVGIFPLVVWTVVTGYVGGNNSGTSVAVTQTATPVSSMATCGLEKRVIEATNVGAPDVSSDERAKVSVTAVCVPVIHK